MRLEQINIQGPKELVIDGMVTQAQAEVLVEAARQVAYHRIGDLAAEVTAAIAATQHEMSTAAAAVLGSPDGLDLETPAAIDQVRALLGARAEELHKAALLARQIHADAYDRRHKLRGLGQPPDLDALRQTEEAAQKTLSGVEGQISQFLTGRKRLKNLEELLAALQAVQPPETPALDLLWQAMNGKSQDHQAA